MKVTITSIRLKSVFHFFSLVRQALYIRKQLNESPCLEVRTRGFWKDHYTMTRWNSEEELKKFAHSGAHRESMKRSGKIASEIRTFTFEADTLPDWKTARKKLREVNPLTFR